MDHAIIIPALNPDEKMIALVEELTLRGAKQIVIVNDGSNPACESVFQSAGERPQVRVLRHSVNLGMGAALKTAFGYCAEHLPGIPGVITADCDGQHTPQDILRISEALAADPGCLILGARAFDKATTPRRSYFGNRTTSWFFHLLYRVHLPDTQSGLRGIPMKEVGWLAKMSGQKYDYDMNMLIQALRRKIVIKQVPIETVYFDNNSGSHFRTVSDSARIIKTLLFNLFSRTYKS